MIKFSAAVLWLTMVGTPLAQPAATNRSQVVVAQEGGARTELRHVRAARFTPASGEVEIRLLFASTDPGEVALADAFGRDQVRRWLRESNATAVKVTFPEANPEQYQIEYLNIDGRTISGGGTASGGETRGVFRKIDITAERLTGELMHNMGDLTLSGTFDTRASAVKEAAGVVGAAVADSPQGQVLLAFARALSKEDLKAAQAHAAGDVQAELEEAKKVFGPDFIKELVKEQFGDMAAFERRLRSSEATLQESGDTARISLVKRTKEASGESTETVSFRLIRMDGKWKVQM